MKAFEYMRPSSLEEACAVLAGADGPARGRSGQGPGRRHRSARADEAGEPAAAGARQPARRARPRLRAPRGRRRARHRRRHAPGGRRELAGRAARVPGHRRSGGLVHRLGAGAQPGDRGRQPVQRGPVRRHGAHPHRLRRRGGHHRRPGRARACRWRTSSPDRARPSSGRGELLKAVARPAVAGGQFREVLQDLPLGHGLLHRRAWPSSPSSTRTRRSSAMSGWLSAPWLPLPSARAPPRGW